MKRITIPTTDVTVPSGYTVTFKTVRSYGDAVEIRNRTLGNAPINETGAELVTTVAQAQESVIALLSVMLTAWDVTEDDNTPTLLTEDNMKAIFSDEDVNFLTTAISTKPDPKS